MYLAESSQNNKVKHQIPYIFCWNLNLLKKSFIITHSHTYSLHVIESLLDLTHILIIHFFLESSTSSFGFFSVSDVVSCGIGRNIRTTEGPRPFLSVEEIVSMEYLIEMKGVRLSDFNVVSASQFMYHQGKFFSNSQ